MQFHHIGIATENIKETIEFINKTFKIKKVSDIVFDSNQNAYLCMLTMEDGTNLELISGDIVKNFLKKNQRLYHIGYSVEDIELAINKFLQTSVVLSAPKKAILFDGKRVVFVMTEIGLIELIER